MVEQKQKYYVAVGDLLHTTWPGSYLLCDLLSAEHCTSARSCEQPAPKRCLSTFSFSMQSPRMRAEAGPRELFFLPALPPSLSLSNGTLIEEWKGRARLLLKEFKFVLSDSVTSVTT